MPNAPPYQLIAGHSIPRRKNLLHVIRAPNAVSPSSSLATSTSIPSLQGHRLVVITTLSRDADMHQL